MGVRERRERERDELRGKILDAARELFAAHGYEAVSMRKIAEKIEYSPTAIYTHFEDKRAVMSALCDADFLVLARRFHTIAQIPDPLERLRATGLAYAEFALAHPNHYRLMFMTAHPHEDADESRIEKGNPDQDAYAFLRNTVAEAIAEGRIRAGFDDADLVAQLMWTAVHGLVSLRITHGQDPWVEWKPERELIERMIDVLFAGLTPAGG